MGFKFYLRKPSSIIFVLGFFVFCSPLFSSSIISKDEIQQLGLKHGEMAKRRLSAWVKIIDDNQDVSEQRKLKLVNDFFNQFVFHSDISFVGESDYWMTPIEFIVNGGGDCEDFSIAKYFTLLALGVPMDKMRIMYVKALSLNQAHMVLAYYEHNNSEPLLLDNLISAIKTGEERTDLRPVYSFNGEGLWLNKLRGQSSKVGNSSQLSKWTLLLKRMKERTK